MEFILGIRLAFRIIFDIVVYAVCAGSLYVIANRNSVKYPYLAFIPIVQYYVIGAICEEYVIKGYRIKNLSLMMCVFLLIQTFSGFLGYGAAFLVEIVVGALVALIMHKFYYLFVPQYALPLALASLIGGRFVLAIILFFIKDKPMCMSAAAYRYPFE